MQLLSDSPSVVERAVLSGVHILPMPNRQLMMVMSYLMMPFMRSSWMAHLNANALHIPPGQFDGYHRSFRQMSRQAFLKASGDAVNFEVPENISSIAVPTLITAGENEQALIHKSQQALVKMTPHIEAYIAPNVGHGWSLEAPQLFAEMIYSWIQAQPLPDQLQLVV
ncbi:MAG: alpha/beta hydrolase [Cyanobacteria bacterium P01_A01_bin.17]